MTKKLILIPIVHSEKEMGSLKSDISEMIDRKFGKEKRDQHRKDVALFWETLRTIVDAITHNVDCTTIRIFQDGIPIGGEVGVKLIRMGAEDGIPAGESGLPIHTIRLSMNRADIEVFGDKLPRKVFYNLFKDSLQYGGEQRIAITVTAHEEDDSLIILFEDNGVGISENVRKPLSEHGFGKHTGLGLFLSREILAITGITITENGEPGKGARFEIRVPKGTSRVNIGSDPPGRIP